MQTSVLIFHPDLSSSQTNLALANIAQNLPNVSVRNMYDQYPNGSIDVAFEQTQLQQAKRIVLQFPMYWYSAPALMKQWQDDVLTHGFAYGRNGFALKDKLLKAVVSLGASHHDYQSGGKVGYTVDDLLLPLKATANHTQMHYTQPLVVSSKMGETELSIQLEHYRDWLLA